MRVKSSTGRGKLSDGSEGAPGIPHPASTKSQQKISDQPDKADSHGN